MYIADKHACDYSSLENRQKVDLLVYLASLCIDTACVKWRKNNIESKCSRSTSSRLDDAYCTLKEEGNCDAGIHSS
jgi:hypothetical protein